MGRGIHCAGNYKNLWSFKMFHSLYDRAVKRERAGEGYGLFSSRLQHEQSQTLCYL